ncbi:hypothetical protein L210DRAFT_3509313 [Boletus edulis BED1]|uniref:Uncharacterized protein n=1 Tax=Boletus edulis BED1 TaxID=1328754 RepID=A0AAD4BEP8_BOLED|nr:hypothetical protein L210DRAFT_3509313 [Boletus edulis BED1]
MYNRGAIFDYRDYRVNMYGYFAPYCIQTNLVMSYLMNQRDLSQNQESKGQDSLGSAAAVFVDLAHKLDQARPEKAVVVAVTPAVFVALTPPIHGEVGPDAVVLIEPETPVPVDAEPTVVVLIIFDALIPKPEPVDLPHVEGVEKYSPLFEVPAEAEAEAEEEEKAVKEKSGKENSLSGAEAEEVGQQDGEVVGEEGKESASGACVEHEDVQSDDVVQVDDSRSLIDHKNLPSSLAWALEPQDGVDDGKEENQEHVDHAQPDGRKLGEK